MWNFFYRRRIFDRSKQSVLLFNHDYLEKWCQCMHSKLTEPMVKFNLRINAVDFLNEWTNNTMHDDAWIELRFRNKKPSDFVTAVYDCRSISHKQIEINIFPFLSPFYIISKYFTCSLHQQMWERHCQDNYVDPFW